MKNRRNNTAKHTEYHEFDSTLGGRDVSIRFKRTTEWSRSQEVTGWEWSVDSDEATDIEVVIDDKVYELALFSQLDRRTLLDAIDTWMTDNPAVGQDDSEHEPDWDSLADERRENEDW